MLFFIRLLPYSVRLEPVLVCTRTHVFCTCRTLKSGRFGLSGRYYFENNGNWRKRGRLRQKTLAPAWPSGFRLRLTLAEFKTLPELTGGESPISPHQNDRGLGFSKDTILRAASRDVAVRRCGATPHSLPFIRPAATPAPSRGRSARRQCLSCRSTRRRDTCRRPNRSCSLGSQTPPGPSGQRWS